jgi:hypothetical protein
VLNYFAILPILSAVLCIGLGLFTLSRNPWHPSNVGFMLGMVGLAAAETGNSLIFISGIKGQTSIPGLQIALIGQAVLPPAWLIFSLVFARANYKEILSRWAPVLIGMGMVSVFFCIPDKLSQISLILSHYRQSQIEFFFKPHSSPYRRNPGTIFPYLHNYRACA